MSTFHPYQLLSISLIYLLSPTTLVRALPLHIRQNGATTVHTVHTTQTTAGPVTETCEIALTPITDANGKPAVQEVKKCSLAFAGGDVGRSTTIPGSTETITRPTRPISVTTTSTISSAITTINSVPASSPATSVASGIATQIVSMSAPTRTGSASARGSESAMTATIATLSSSGTTVQGVETSGASTAAAFQLPGKKLSVLPIGLGVFAGISVIALVVVGLVTYERTKYRKAFRQRKLAESGAAMGHGGMVQRI